MTSTHQRNHEYLVLFSEHDKMWFIRNKTLGQNVMGFFADKEKAERAMIRMTVPIGRERRLLLRALVAECARGATQEMLVKSCMKDLGPVAAAELLKKFVGYGWLEVNEGVYTPSETGRIIAV